MPAHTETKFRLVNLRGRDKRNMYLHSNNEAFEHLNLRPRRLNISPPRRVGNSKRVKCYRATKIAKRVHARYINNKECRYVMMNQSVQESTRDFNMLSVKREKPKKVVIWEIITEQGMMFRLSLKNSTMQLKVQGVLALVMFGKQWNYIRMDEICMLLNYANDHYLFCHQNGIWRTFTFFKTIRYLHPNIVYEKLLYLLKTIFHSRWLIHIVKEYIVIDDFFETDEFFLELSKGWVIHRTRDTITSIYDDAHLPAVQKSLLTKPQSTADIDQAYVATLYG